MSPRAICGPRQSCAQSKKDGDGYLVLREILLEITESERVSPDEVDGEVEHERNDEEGQPDQARKSAQQQPCCDAEPRWERMGDRRVERRGEGDAGEGEMSEVGRAERGLVGEEEGAEGGEGGRDGEGGGGEEVDEAFLGWRGLVATVESRGGRTFD